MPFAVFLLGALVPVAVQATLGWWLDSGAGVFAVAAALAVLAAGLTGWQRERAMVIAIALSVGTVAGTAVLLAGRGAGTIWPIVLAFAAAISAVAAAAGAGVTRMLKTDN